MIRQWIIIWGITVLAAAAQADGETPRLNLYEVESGQVMPLEEAVERMADSRIVLVGEHHTRASHHEAQLQIISALEKSGRSVAVGFEMFRSDANPDLESWVDGTLSEEAFERIYLDNWNFPWPLYRMLFVHAREAGLPLIGLNVSREITRQVARQGFQSLSEAQKGSLPIVTCDVDENYMAFIRGAHGAHGHGGMNFTHFCEAQLVWDKSMAANAVRYIDANPGKALVVIAGTGHARKGGIPAQIREISKAPFTVILPEVPGSLDKGSMTVEDADYLILNLAP
ncbi:MAG: ChaN family lipoprotein [Desulfobacterales bacterium]